MGLLPGAIIEKKGLIDDALNSAGVGFVVVDKKGRFISFNRAGEKLIGIGASAATPGQWAQHYGIFNPDTLEIVPTSELPLVKAINGESVQDMDLFMRNSGNPEGAIIRVTARPVKKNGRPAGAFCIFWDVTEERRMAEVQRRLEGFIEGAQDAVLCANIDGSIVSWNKSAERLLGYSPMEVMGRPLSILAPKTGLKEQQEFISRMLSGETISQATVRIHKNGSKVAVWLKASPIRGPQGRIIGFGGFLLKRAGRHREEAHFQGDLAKPTIWRLGGVSLNVTQRKVFSGAKEVSLTRKEFELLRLFLERKGHVLSPQLLLQMVWEHDLAHYNDTHTVEVHLSRLKKKLGKRFSSRLTTLIGVGYRLD